MRQLMPLTDTASAACKTMLIVCSAGRCQAHQYHVALSHSRTRSLQNAAYMVLQTAYNCPVHATALCLHVRVRPLQWTPAAAEPHQQLKW
jgi:hypothetical protein